jgi:hypothetical protein
VPSVRRPIIDGYACRARSTARGSLAMTIRSTRAGPASSRLDFATLSESSLETAVNGFGDEDARKLRRSACRSIWSLWSRCRCLWNCLDPLRLERTLVRLASLFRRPARVRINNHLRGLAAWVVLGSPACNPSILGARDRSAIRAGALQRAFTLMSAVAATTPAKNVSE